MYHYMDSLDKDISKEKHDMELRDESPKADFSILSGVGATAGIATSDDFNTKSHHDNQQKSGSPVEKHSHPSFMAMTNVDLTKADQEDTNSDKTLLEKIDETKEEADENHGKNNERDYLENTDDKHRQHEQFYDKSDDHADGPFLDQKMCIKPPPPSTTDKEEKDWLVDCLYYTIVCCDCAIM